MDEYLEEALHALLRNGEVKMSRQGQLSVELKLDIDELLRFAVYDYAKKQGNPLPPYEAVSDWLNGVLWSEAMSVTDAREQ